MLLMMLAIAAAGGVDVGDVIATFLLLELEVVACAAVIAAAAATADAAAAAAAYGTSVTGCSPTVGVSAATVPVADANRLGRPA